MWGKLSRRYRRNQAEGMKSRQWAWKKSGCGCEGKRTKSKE